MNFAFFSLCRNTANPGTHVHTWLMVYYNCYIDLCSKPIKLIKLKASWSNESFIFVKKTWCFAVNDQTSYLYSFIYIYSFNFQIMDLPGDLSRLHVKSPKSPRQHRKHVTPSSTTRMLAALEGKEDNQDEVFQPPPRELQNPRYRYSLKMVWK